MQETQVQSLDKEVPLEKGMATHSSIPAWRTAWTEQPSGLQSTGLQRVGHNWATNTSEVLTFTEWQALALEKEMAPHSSTRAWRILWTGEPGGLLFIGSHRVGHDWSDLSRMHALEKEMATHSSVLAWRIPGTGEPGGLPSVGSQSQTRLKWLSSSSSSRHRCTNAPVYYYFIWSTEPPMRCIMILTYRGKQCTDGVKWAAPENTTKTENADQAARLQGQGALRPAEKTSGRGRSEGLQGN